MNINLFRKAEREPLWATDRLHFIRTEPTPDGIHPYIGYVKTTMGEAKVAGTSKPVHEVLMSGTEITKEEYEAKEVGHVHSWRAAWLKNSKVTRKVTFCTLCGELQRDDSEARH